jgi:hypothetical protein
VPLSEHEQRVLEQIERALYADDPKFAATVRGIDPRTLHRRRYARASVGGVIGVVLLPVGIAVGQIGLSLGGFVLMLLAFLYGAATWRQTRERVDAPGAAAGTAGATAAPGFSRPTDIGRARRRRGKTAPSRPVAKRGFMQRFEERWDRRRGGLGGSEPGERD